MIVTTGLTISGMKIAQVIGVMRSPNIGQSFLGGLQSLNSGNSETFAKICDEARQHAYDRMISHAQHMGADAIIGTRYDAAEFAQSMTEVLAHGTAVKLHR